MKKFERVFERDIDFYILNKFANDNHFKDIFLDVIDVVGYDVTDFFHSYSDDSGESDITIILSNNQETIALLIEDKISAIAMPNQYSRYLERGENMINDGIFDRFYVFIIAPESYLDGNHEAAKYDYKISYETILNHIQDDVFGKELLEEAIREKKKSYSVIENVSVTSFWNRYYKLIDNRYPTLKIKRHNRARGNKAQWPIFSTPVDYVQIFHKSNKGCVDLVFPRLSQHYFDVYDIVEDKLKEHMSLQKTGKSLSIRTYVPVVDFHHDFDEQIENIIECLDAVSEMVDLLRHLNCKEILKLNQ